MKFFMYLGIPVPCAKYSGSSMLAFDLLDEFRIFPPELIPAGLPYLAGLPELKTTCLECLLVFVVELTNVAGVGAGGPATGSSDGI